MEPKTKKDKSHFLTKQFTRTNAGAWVPLPRWFLDDVLRHKNLQHFGRFFAVLWNLTVGGRPVRGADPTHVAGNLRLHISSRDWASRAAIHPAAASRFLVAMAKCGIVRYGTITPDETGTSDKSEVVIIPAALFDCELMQDFVSALDDEIENESYTRNEGGKRLNNNATFATNVHVIFSAARGVRQAAQGVRL